jgi:hypothetical protein
MSDSNPLRHFPEVALVLSEIQRQFGDAARIASGHMAIGVFGTERHNQFTNPCSGRETWRRHDFVAHAYMTNHAFEALREITGTDEAVRIRLRILTAIRDAQTLQFQFE